MIVYLLRHGAAADTAPDADRSDDARPLTERGAETLGRAAEVYARLMVRPDRVLTSPLLRAVQSAEILTRALGGEPAAIATRSLHYSIEPTRILDELQSELFDECDAIALVGHEPQLGNLLGLLLTGSERVSVPLSKGMLAGVELKEPQTMIGRLRICLSTKAARKLPLSGGRGGESTDR